LHNRNNLTAIFNFQMKPLWTYDETRTTVQYSNELSPGDGVDWRESKIDDLIYRLRYIISSCSYLIELKLMKICPAIQQSTESWNVLKPPFSDIWSRTKWRAPCPRSERVTGVLCSARCVVFTLYAS
jgi:hypothetical protein